MEISHAHPSLCSNVLYGFEAHNLQLVKLDNVNQPSAIQKTMHCMCAVYCPMGAAWRKSEESPVVICLTVIVLSAVTYCHTHVWMDVHSSMQQQTTSAGGQTSHKESKTGSDVTGVLLAICKVCWWECARVCVCPGMTNHHKCPAGIIHHTLLYPLQTRTTHALSTSSSNSSSWVKCSTCQVSPLLLCATVGIILHLQAHTWVSSACFVPYEHTHTHWRKIWETSVIYIRVKQAKRAHRINLAFLVQFFTFKNEGRSTIME